MSGPDRQAAGAFCVLAIFMVMGGTIAAFSFLDLREIAANVWSAASVAVAFLSIAYVGLTFPRSDDND